MHLNPEQVDFLNDADLRRACILLLQRDVGPVVDSTRDVYRLALKRALMGLPPSEERWRNSSIIEPRNSSPQLPRSPSPQAPRNSSPQLPRSPSPQLPRSPSPQAPRNPSLQAPRNPSLQAPRSPSRGSLPVEEQPVSHFFRNATIIGLGSVLVALFLIHILQAHFEQIDTPLRPSLDHI